MAAHGGPLMLNHTLIEDDLGFEAGMHYVEFDLSNFEEQARALLANPPLRKAISEAAYSRIQAHHTWDHRVQQILKDLAR
jgi:spore maturation protein CgeB